MASRIASPSAVRLPEGLSYFADFLAPTDERDLIERLSRLRYNEIRMHGLTAKRRTIHYGVLCGYESWTVTPGPPIPDYLLALRGRAAGLTEVPAADFKEVLVSEYRPGAAIGWHRDAPMFGPTVIGVSLGAACRLRLRQGPKSAERPYEILLAPRSAYVLAGPARKLWQHSIPPVKELRYSITFRTLLQPLA